MKKLIEIELSLVDVYSSLQWHFMNLHETSSRVDTNEAWQ